MELTSSECLSGLLNLHCVRWGSNKTWIRIYCKSHWSHSVTRDQGITLGLFLRTAQQQVNEVAAQGKGSRYQPRELVSPALSIAVHVGNGQPEEWKKQPGWSRVPGTRVVWDSCSVSLFTVLPNLGTNFPTNPTTSSSLIVQKPTVSSTAALSSEESRLGSSQKILKEN